MIFLSQDTVNSEIFARVLFSRNFEIKYREIGKSLSHLLMKVNHVIVAIFYLKICLLALFEAIKFLLKFPNLQYWVLDS